MKQLLLLMVTMIAVAGTAAGQTGTQKVFASVHVTGVTTRQVRCYDPGQPSRPTERCTLYSFKAYSSRVRYVFHCAGNSNDCGKVHAGEIYEIDSFNEGLWLFVDDHHSINVTVDSEESR